MADLNERLKRFSVELFKINAIKFGEYQTKIGLMTPIYCDLRLIVSYPKLMVTLADLIVDHLQYKFSEFDVICGVPYTALPIATAVSLKSHVPMVIRRKERKDHGTRRLIEGCFADGANCLVIEDVVTSGSSILETVTDLRSSGLKCTDAIVLLNREQGGGQLLANERIHMHALVTMTQLMGYLREAACIADDVVERVLKYVASNQVNGAMLLKQPAENRLKLSYLSRAKYSKNIIAQDLFKLMVSKETNLCIAADLTTCAEVLNLAEQVGPHVCLFKTHVDILVDYHPNFIKRLQDISDKHRFILFEDRKFADIGKTVEYQYSKGVYKISTWANVVTAHSITGKGVLEAIKQSPGVSRRGVFLLGEVSAACNLVDKSYTDATVKLAMDYPDLITGIVCQNPLFLDQPGFLQLTPGVRLDCKGDSLSQQYNLPEFVVAQRGGDIAVVGRGITEDADPELTAGKYKDQLWFAYCRRIEIE